MQPSQLEQLKTAIDMEIAAFGEPVKAAYFYRDTDDPALTLSAHAEDRVVSASMIKLPVMMCLFDLLLRNAGASGDDSGRPGSAPDGRAAGMGSGTGGRPVTLLTELPVTAEDILDDSMIFDPGRPRNVTIRELCHNMIVYSDNTSTNVLLRFLTFDRINAYCRSIGLCETFAARYMLDFKAVEEGRNNYISAMDFYRCCKRIREEADVPEEAFRTGFIPLPDWKKTDIRSNPVRYGRDLAREGLKNLRSNADYEDMRRYLYEGQILYHKTGELEDIIHDAGYITCAAPEADYFLGVFLSEFAPGERDAGIHKAEKLCGRISRVVADFYR